MLSSLEYRHIPKGHACNLVLGKEGEEGRFFGWQVFQSLI
jgi:hypothetical protein